MTTALNCPKCGTINTSNQKFCGECGNALVGIVASSTSISDASSPNMSFNAPTQEPTFESSFSFSGCIVSFLTTFAIAVTLGLAGIFVLGLILTSMFNLSGDSVIYCTGIVYFILFGIIWWAIYTQIRGNKTPKTIAITNPQNTNFETRSTEITQREPKPVFIEHHDKSTHNSKIKVYKRYSPSENQVPILELPNADDKSRLILGAESEQTASVYCPWCEQVYEIGVIGDNIMFNCVKCKNDAFVSRD